ncbi:hypothetical protein MIND_00439700 [Mycena indigotica]|uniref:Uncharacterized protein n=1 Tax=Mycena indigotica TaxID=2126181 RepID=A0A8H6SW63_9AGAR|nr:uncharacterized protein MIND_00439700 [Mycena indigotica]KAF7306484.1 hypothetical protein MIND_00439700 [Mycena indigotica]
MARATRSQDTLKSPKHELKKRKLGDDSLDEQPDKFQRIDAPPLAATNPIEDETATKILHILESIDEQGLLDRVYEPPHSLRSLLQSPAQHSLATLRAAVLNLRPLSSHPRQPLYPPAAQQQRFCDTALSLLDQASFTPLPPETTTESLFPDNDEPGSRLLTTKRYALMQRLPDGDYFTSTNIDLGADLKDLSTGHADLVAVLPGPSVTSLPSNLPKLGDYHIAKPEANVLRRFHPLPSRRVSHGMFLDYGPYSSFAPTWNQDGAEIGMRQMGEYYAQRAKRHKERFLAAKEAAAKSSPPLPVKRNPSPPLPSSEPIHVDREALQDILSADEIDGLTSVLGNLEIENSVHELLERNRRALSRLAQLQERRMRFENGIAVKEGDEEWDLAQGILSSLTLLSSLRPRSSVHPTSPLVPPPDVIHTLMRTLPRTAVPGWHGTLPPRNSTQDDKKVPPALRGDTTARIRPGVAAKAPPPPPMEVSTPGLATAYAAAYYTPQATRSQTTRYSTRASTSSAVPQQSYYPQQQQQPQQQTAYAGSTTQIPYGSAGWAQYTSAVGSATPTHVAYGATNFATPGVTGSKAVANTVLARGGATNWGVPPALPPHLRSAVG